MFDKQSEWLDPTNLQNNEADKNLLVKFTMEPVENQQKSIAEGRPIFDDVEFIWIACPGENKNIIHRPIRAEDKIRFQSRYRAWKDGGKSDAQSGTPLTEWPGIKRSIVEELAYRNVRTVEQLADISDGNCQGFQGIQALKQRAKDWLLKAKDGAMVETMRAALGERDNEIETLKRLVREQSERIDEIQKKRAS